MDKIADEGISSSDRRIGLLADQPDVRYSLAQRLSGASCGEPAIVGNPSQADEHDNETDDQRNSRAVDMQSGSAGQCQLNDQDQVADAEDDQAEIGRDLINQPGTHTRGPAGVLGSLWRQKDSRRSRIT